MRSERPGVTCAEPPHAARRNTSGSRRRIRESVVFVALRVGLLVLVLAAAAAVALVLALGRSSAAHGSFASSDPRLNAIWEASVRTAHDMVSAPVHLHPGCGVPRNERVILDGVTRDRCEFPGDLAVTGM